MGGAGTSFLDFWVGFLVKCLNVGKNRREWAGQEPSFLDFWRGVE